MAFLKTDDYIGIEFSLSPSKKDVKKSALIKLVFLYGKNYPIISNLYDYNEFYEIENILDGLFYLLAGKENDIHLFTLDDEFTININNTRNDCYRVEAHMDTPSIVFSCDKYDILDFTISLAKECRKIFPNEEKPMIEKALTVLKIVKSKKEKGVKLLEEEWKAFCLYALYIDNKELIPNVSSFKALDELKKKITS